VREDASGEIVVGDLLELHADSVETLHGIIETGRPRWMDGWTIFWMNRCAMVVLCVGDDVSQ